MRVEAVQAPAAVARLLAAEQKNFAALGEELRQHPPLSILTVARGSSDHAAHYMAYLVMARLGRLVTSLPMSLITLYPASLRCDGLVAFVFSQSGQSPDLLAPTRYIGEHGGRTVALVNDATSPLALAAQQVFPLHAGPETSVAATKSYLCQLVAGASVTAAWQQDAAFSAALEALPASLKQAAAQDWSAGIEALLHAERLYVIGRGTGLPVAMEVALKFKELCGIHAEAFSSAEVQHGPTAPNSAQSSRIALMGLRGAGKSTLGRMLADDLGFPFVELSAEIEKFAGCTIAEIQALYGMNAYRRYERRALEEAIQIYAEAVIAIPGGLVSDPATFNQLLSHCTTVWLQAAPEDHMGRVAAQGDMRPMAASKEAMEDLKGILSGRTPFYSKAQYRVDTSAQPLTATFQTLRTTVRKALQLPD